jgi:glyoxylase-like metal-dependent hydrolase (beta-lactamase superfamily II)
VFPSASQLTPLVRRILGQNPGPYTLQGTNTYLIGRTGGNAILLDTGQGEPAYVPLLRKALSNYSGVSDIILSHHHHDHILGLQQVIPLLKEMGMQAPRIHKLPSKDASLDKPTSDILKELPPDSFHPGSPSLFHHLADNQVFSIDRNAHLSIVHTPGHTDDSVSLLFKENDSAHLFTADTVLGQGTAVFTDLKALLDSLQRCINLVDSEDGQRVKLFCGHGPVVQDGVAKMQEYITHRLQREKQVLEALEKAGKPETAGK